MSFGYQEKCMLNIWKCCPLVVKSERWNAILTTILSPFLHKQEVPFDMLNNTFPSKDFLSLKLKVTIVIISKKRFFYLGSFGKS